VCTTCYRMCRSHASPRPTFCVAGASSVGFLSPVHSRLPADRGRILEAPMVDDVLHVVSESFVQFVPIHILQHAHFFRRHVKPILFFWIADAQHHGHNAERPPPQTFPVVVLQTSCKFLWVWGISTGVKNGFGLRYCVLRLKRVKNCRTKLSCKPAAFLDDSIARALGFILHAKKARVIQNICAFSIFGRFAGLNCPANA
jgi:hypothetical protein